MTIKIITLLIALIFGGQEHVSYEVAMDMADIMHEEEAHLYYEDYTEEQAEVIKAFMSKGYGQYMTVTSVDDVHATITDEKGNSYKIPEREYLTNDTVFVIVDAQGEVRFAMWVSYLSPEENQPSKNIDGMFTL